ncbi:hypothetical protein C8Q80DRAFT_299102 [Daedaleopsis nitida]|nr:hypothetical protein C8Q80DRAFT_299102 [Daedaleopsis nitida]
MRVSTVYPQSSCTRSLCTHAPTAGAPGAPSLSCPGAYMPPPEERASTPSRCSPALTGPSAGCSRSSTRPATQRRGRAPSCPGSATSVWSPTSSSTTRTRTTACCPLPTRAAARTSRPSGVTSSSRPSQRPLDLELQKRRGLAGRRRRRSGRRSWTPWRRGTTPPPRRSCRRSRGPRDTLRPASRRVHRRAQAPAVPARPARLPQTARAVALRRPAALPLLDRGWRQCGRGRSHPRATTCPSVPRPVEAPHRQPGPELHRHRPRPVGPRRASARRAPRHVGCLHPQHGPRLGAKPALRNQCALAARRARPHPRRPPDPPGRARRRRTHLGAHAPLRRGGRLRRAPGGRRAPRLRAVLLLPGRRRRPRHRAAAGPRGGAPGLARAHRARAGGGCEPVDGRDLRARFLARVQGRWVPSQAGHIAAGAQCGLVRPAAPNLAR